MKNKKELRKEIRALKKQQDADKLKEKAGEIFARLENCDKFKESEIILMYYSLPDEVPTHDFVEKWKEQKIILLPVVVGDDLILRRYTGRESLRTGAYNIEEPIGELYEDYDKIELGLIPGMSFDKTGNRLGRGKGYYDRLLPRLKNSYNIGICFDFQISEQVPAEEHDCKMNEIIYG